MRSTTPPSPFDRPRSDAAVPPNGPCVAAAATRQGPPRRTVSGRTSRPRRSRWPPASRCCAGRWARPDATPLRRESSPTCSRTGWRTGAGRRWRSCAGLSSRPSATILRYWRAWKTTCAAVVAHDPACRSALHALLHLKGFHALQTPSGRAQPVAARTRRHRPLAVKPGLGQPRRRHPPGGADRQGRDARPRNGHRDRRNRRRRGRRDRSSRA